MQQSACVSIVVPIYNQEKYLDAAIASLTGQSYSNLQIVLVNDGSTDGSTDMLRRYAQTDSRIELIEKPNGGVMDATVVGIQAARGEYICFMDPDDLLGKDYVSTLMEHMTPDCDFVAAGFYYEKNGVLTPYCLREDRFYTQSELRQHRDDFLNEKGFFGVSNRFFISRWNKLYRTGIIKATLERLEGYKHISLGDDTLLTYLVLTNSRGGRTLSRANSYYYNVGNPNSMMKMVQVQPQMDKSWWAYEAMKALVEEFGTSDSQAYALYGFLVNTLRQRLLESNYKQFCQLVRQLRKNAVYQRSREILAAQSKSRIKRLYRSFVKKDTELDLIMGLLKPAAKHCYGILRTWKKHVAFYLKKRKTKSLIRALRLLRFQRHREQAYVQMVRKLPKMDRRIAPFLQPYFNQATNPDECPIENNIFVLWWDGLEQAPTIVRSCFASVKQWHPDCNVVLVDKNNYRQYTDIDPVIIDAFEKDKVSVQTFSDILRFNLLKNNGGVWVDATIFFTSECNLLKDLENKPFTSLAFSTSSDFLQYEGIVCSWSGFFIASRKNSVFVRAVDDVFRQYFLKYHTYSTYFFIDITLMLCKKYGIDNDALSHTLYTNRSMFTLAHLLDAPFDPNVLEFVRGVPQKLRWNITANEGNTFCRWLLEQ